MTNPIVSHEDRVRPPRIVVRREPDEDEEEDEDEPQDEEDDADDEDEGGYSP